MALLALSCLLKMAFLDTSSGVMMFLSLALGVACPFRIRFTIVLGIPLGSLLVGKLGDGKDVRSEGNFPLPLPEPKPDPKFSWLGFDGLEF